MQNLLGPDAKGPEINVLGVSERMFFGEVVMQKMQVVIVVVSLASARSNHLETICYDTVICCLSCAA